MRKIVVVLGGFLLFFSCEEELNLNFTEINAIYKESAIIEINIPKAEGKSALSKAINSTLENHIASVLNFSEEDSETIQLDEAIKHFETEFKAFKSDYEESAMVWEAVFDGEVIYQSPEVICIAINGYTNTGGAHGNMNITLYNFDIKDGAVLKHDDIILKMEEFMEIAKQYFTKEIEAQGEDMAEDYFFEEGFHLPANIGFNDEGILLLYNVYEIASYAQGLTEFTIPFEEVNSFLKVH